MKIVKIDGDLGQQMFQYAFFLALAETDDSSIMTGKKLLPEDIFGLTCLDRFMPCRGIRLPWRNNPYTDYATIKEPQDYRYEPGIIKNSPENAIFEGKWLSYRYFDSIEDKVRNEFRFIHPIPQRFANMMHEISSSAGQQSVAMHIAGTGNKQNTCTRDYYNWAVANINAFLPEARFFIFAESAKWVQENIVGLPEKTIVTDCKNTEQHILLRLMAAADHVIMSSTLTDWWAGYLNENPDKIVIAPKQWYKDGTPCDLLPLHWTIIPVT